MVTCDMRVRPKGRTARFVLTQGRRWPPGTTLRLFSGFWLLFCLVVTVSYVSNLTAFLTVPALSPTVDTLEELVDSNFVWGINDFGAADYQLFKTSKVKSSFFFCVG